MNIPDTAAYRLKALRKAGVSFKDVYRMADARQKAFKKSIEEQFNVKGELHE
jgi:hypothetical protein